MDRQTLDLFCRQLTHWADAAIASGRSPFRRTERFYPLLTAAGEIAPPLILWINRDSCMAGAVLLFPPRAAEEMQAEGCACAEALGLRHFVTWAAREIVIWETAGNSATRHRLLPTPAEDLDTPATFCDIFRTLLEELKPLSVTGAVAPAELSPFYLANLCRLTIQAVTPPLAESYRLTRSEGADRQRLLPGAVLQQAYLLLLRLLTLSIEDRLPPTIETEGLERALRFALDSLPLALFAPLDAKAWEIPLPATAAVRLHHLIRRLTQLRFAGDRSRALRTVEILLDSTASALGGTPPPPTPDEAPAASVLLNPDCCFPASGLAAEIASPALLACTALLRYLRAESAVPQRERSFLLEGLSEPVLIRGSLSTDTPLTAAERHTLTMRLRLAWPHRRFQLPPATPLWVYEFLYLLGLAADGTRFVLDLPDDWLTAPWGMQLHSLLSTHFTLIRLARQPGGIRIDLCKSRDAVEETTLFGAAGERRLAWDRLQEEPLSFLLLALDLPAPFFTLLHNGKLQSAREPSAEYASGIYLFSRSSLGRLMWQILGRGRSFPPRQSLPAHLQRTGFPLPEEQILRQLQSVFALQENPARPAIDRQLADWFGVDTGAHTGNPAGRRRPERRLDRPAEDVLAEIRRSVFADGLPRFPEQFLYDHYRPHLVEYAFSGRLTPGEDFLGEQKLTDQAGNVLVVEGNETARALLLASYGGAQPVRLPADRQLTEKILGQYLDRLFALRRALVRESLRRLNDDRLAEAVVEKIWEESSLPPWSLLTS